MRFVRQGQYYCSMISQLQINLYTKKSLRPNLLLQYGHYSLYINGKNTVSITVPSDETIFPLHDGQRVFQGTLIPQRKYFLFLSLLNESVNAMGVLSLVIICASNIPSQGIFGTVDAYVNVECRGASHNTLCHKLTNGTCGTLYACYVICSME